MGRSKKSAVIGAEVTFSGLFQADIRSDTNFQALRALALHGDLTRFQIRDKLVEEATKREIETESIVVHDVSTYYRALEGTPKKSPDSLVQLGCVKREGTTKHTIVSRRRTRAFDVEKYSISENGVLAVLLGIDASELSEFVRRVAQKNPFLQFAKELLDAGVQWKIVRKWLVEPLKAVVSPISLKTPDQMRNRIILLHVANKFVELIKELSTRDLDLIAESIWFTKSFDPVESLFLVNQFQNEFQYYCLTRNKLGHSRLDRQDVKQVYDDLDLKKSVKLEKFINGVLSMDIYLSLVGFDLGALFLLGEIYGMKINSQQ